MHRNTSKARELRKNMTPQEYKLWQILRAHRFYGLLFRRQYPIGDYIVDFICRSKQIIIEIDGGQHNDDFNKLYDEKRTQYLNSRGYKVLRFWNNEIDENIDGVYLKLKECFKILD